MQSALSPIPKSLTASIAKNTVFGIIAKTAQVATRLVTVPVVIAHLGLGGYGIWSIIMTAAAYMRFGSVGIKSAFQKYVADATGSGDYRHANQLLSTGAFIMLFLSVIGLVPILLWSEALARSAGVPADFLAASSRSVAILALIMMLANTGAVYEAIVMGAHRIDLARTFTTVFTVAEAVAILIALHYGGGLVSMATIMALSEVGFVACCYIASKAVLPQIKVAREFVTKSVLYELGRFAGTYQLVNVLEIVYNAVMPIAILRGFGADAAGIYAIAARLVSSAMMLPDAFLLPILSGGSMVYAAGQVEKMKSLITKSFKVTLSLSALPLAFICVFGTKVVYAWTGQTPDGLTRMLVWVSLAGLFQGFSTLSLVLYRISGKAVLDNIRQVLRIVIVMLIVAFAHRLGLFGVLSGLTIAEAAGMLFMLVALTKTFPTFRLSALLPDAARLSIAIALTLLAGIAAILIPMPFGIAGRVAASFDLLRVGLGCLAAAIPAVLLTHSLSPSETNALLRAIFPWRSRNA